MRQLTTCPACAEPCEPDDKFCGACGGDLSAASAPVAPAPAPPHAPVSVPAPAAVPASTPVPRQAPAEGSGGATPPDWTLAPPDSSAPPPAPAAPAQPVAPPSPAPPVAPPASGPAAAAQADPRQPAGQPATDGPWAGRLCVACGTGGIDRDGYCENCGHAQPRERDHMERQLDGVAAVSDRGLRHHRNEDAFKVSATTLPDGGPAIVAVVCDGVSSATRPDEASAAASEAATDALLEALEAGTSPKAAMHDALLSAADAVDALSDGPSRDHNAPACTCVSAIAAGDAVTVGWIGDSRAYWIPDDRREPQRLTEDDSWAARMVAAGLMSEQDAYADERAHAITGWLGADAVEIDPHTSSFRPDRPGVVVVCTDGLWNYAESAREMASIVPKDARAKPLRSAQHLVGFALDGGGHDNITVAVLPFPPATGRPPES
ncbi:PP2C family serine/threonine-protein phosphatase [Wenjunlia tyrosinilytica]|uniref:PPM-type phosphatase domain-containing protein n=1 Tax=Wenjunlia tyrosinilytica TaxID=1544741 RepID=A0A918DSG5_9ACTN|nr:PP2C family serine/threonine-protein phosphatase [Wenjunlia tyrosinilytica]GGO81028.1 hypothetical protein GCM10012280_04330 [Wenjunlia tyrosinilytica]